MRAGYLISYLNFYIIIITIHTSNMQDLWNLALFSPSPSQNHQQFAQWYDSIQPPQHSSYYPIIKHKLFIIIYSFLLIQHSSDPFILTYLILVFPFTFTLSTPINHKLLKEICFIVVGNLLISYIFRFLWGSHVIKYVGLLIYAITPSQSLICLSLLSFCEGYTHFLSSSLSLWYFLPIFSIFIHCKPNYSELFKKTLLLVALYIWVGKAYELCIWSSIFCLVIFMEYLDDCLKTHKAKHRNYCEIKCIKQYY